MKTVEIGGFTYTMTQMAAKQALSCGLERAKWIGRVLKSLGDANTTAAQIGASTEMAALMLQDAGYNDRCWLPTLAQVSMPDGRRVLDCMDIEFRGDKLMALLDLHIASYDYSCGAFAGGVTRAALTGTKAPQTTETATS